MKRTIGVGLPNAGQVGGWDRQNGQMMKVLAYSQRGQSTPNFGLIG